MKNRFIKAFNALKSNKGTGILMVLIATLLITVLGVAMLFTSYINLTMKISERQGRINFYDAEEVMDQIKVGFQNYFSEVIADATKSTLTLAPDNTVQRQDFFNEAVRLSMVTGGVKDYQYDNDGNLIIDGITEIPVSTEYVLSGGTTGYRVASLALFLPPHSLAEFNKDDVDDEFTDLALNNDPWEGTYPAKMNIGGDTVIIEKVNENEPMIIEPVEYTTQSGVELTLSSYIFEGIKVTHINGENGYTTTITSDIVLQTPVFNVGQVGYSLNEITSFSMIADDSLQVQGGTDVIASVDNTVELIGNVYAGNITVNQNKNLDYMSGNLIVGPNSENSDIISNASVDIGINGINTLNYTPVFTLHPQAQLWTNEINLFSDADLNILGATYVADDLKFDSGVAGAKFNLTGNYTGFGFGGTEENPLVSSSPLTSSSILIDGKDNDFILGPTSNLLLYGSSYIDTSTIKQQLGESMSPTTSQLAYLIPPEFLSNISSNPYYLNTSAALPDVNSGTVANSVLWEINGRPMTVSDYCVEGNPVNIYRTQSSGASWVYFFFNFKDTDSANQYFNDYFLYGGEDRENYDRISEQLNYHFDEFDTLSANISASGNIIQERPLQEGSNVLYKPDIDFESDEKYQILGGFSDLSQDEKEDITQQYSIQYKSLLRPYSSVVSAKADILDEIGIYEFKMIADEADIHNPAVAIYVNGDYTYTREDIGGSPPEEDIKDDLCLIISSGNVTVNSNFEGLIIADGTITVADGVTVVTSNSTIVRSALSSVLVQEVDGALQVIEEPDGTSFLVAELLSQSGTVEGSEVETTQLENRTIEELVIYENWKKD